MKSNPTHPDSIRRIVRDNYGKIAGRLGGCCSPGGKIPDGARANDLAERIGYSREQIQSVPHSANMGLGCGNPQTIASIRPGETVLDLGSGAGFDCFLAASAVGESGRVIGVDMTDGMIRKARRNAQQAGITNVEFRQGKIEHLPMADRTVDVILSNCVINLSPEKETVFREAYRVLKPGGRLAISDVVTLQPLPSTMLRDKQLLCACIGGATPIEELKQILESVGFTAIVITPLKQSRELIEAWVPGIQAQEGVLSATIQAVKPNSSTTC